MMQRSKRILAGAAGAAMAQLLVLIPAYGAAITWDGGGSDDNLTTAANWAGGVLPATTDDVTFDGAVRTTPTTAGGAVQYNSITFAPTASAFTIGGANAITLGSTSAGQYLNNDTVGVAQTIDAPIDMIGGNVNATQGDLILNGLFNIGNGASAAGNNVTFQGTNNITLNGGITGAGTASSAGGTMFIGGSGTVTLTADSSAWQGNVFVNGGALRITNANALGTGGGRIETALSSGGTGLGTLELDGSAGGFTLTKPVTTRARQGTTINEVAIRNVAGNNTISTVSTGTGGVQFNYESAAGNLTIANWNTTGSGGSRTLRLSGAGNGEIQNWAPASGNVITLQKDDAGTWALRSGMINANGTFTTTTVNGGTLVLDGGVGANVTGNVTVNSGGTLQVVAPDGTTGEVGNSATPTTLTVKAGGTLDASTFTTYSGQAGQTLIIGGTVKTGGVLSTFGDNAIYIGDSSTPAAGTMNVQGNLSLSNAFAPSPSNGGLHFDLANTTTEGAGVNDLLSINGDLQVDTSNGPVNIFINPLQGALASGTYRLIDLTSGSTPNTADFTLNSSNTGQTRQTLSLASAVDQLNLVVTGAPANLVWAGDGSANNWDVVTTKNWVNGVTPDYFYQFDNVTFDDSTTNTNVNLAAALTPGSVTVNTAQTYTFTGSGSISTSTLTKGGAGTLTIANTGGDTVATGGVIINGGTLQIGNGGADGSIAASNITDNGALIVNKSSTDTMSGAISGSGSLEKAGTGTLILTGANTYGGTTTVDAGGTLQIGNGGTTGSIGTGTVTTNGTLAFNRSDDITYVGSIAGTGGLTQAGGDVLTLTGANTYTGTTAINGGTLRATIGTNIDPSSNLSFGGGVLKTTNTTISRTLGTGAGQIQFTGGNTGIATDGADLAITLSNGGTPILWGTAPFAPGSLVLNQADSTNNVTLNLPDGLDLNGANRTILSNAGTTTINGVISDSSATPGRLQLDGPDVTSTANSTIVLTQSSTFAGGADIDPGPQGKLIVLAEASNALGTGSVTLSPGGNATNTRLELSGGITLPNAIGFNGRNNDSVGIENIDGDNTLSGKLNASPGGNRYWIQSDAGTLTLSGADAAAGGVALSAASGSRTYTLRGAGNGTVSGNITNGGGTVSITKADAGTWNLSGALSYTGPTAITGGTLALATNLTTSSGITVSGGALQLATGGGNDRVIVTPTPTITAGAIDLTENKMIVTTAGATGTWDNTAQAYNGVTGMVASARHGGAWDGSGITSSMASTGGNNLYTLGVAKVGDIKQIADTDTSTIAGQTVHGSDTIVMYTYGGDANLDGKINIDDYGRIDGNVGQSGSVFGWYNGDFNYDGKINIDDYGIIDGNIGLQGTPIPTVGGAQALAVAADGVSAVPEPASLGLLAILGAGALNRRKRRVQ